MARPIYPPIDTIELFEYNLGISREELDGTHQHLFGDLVADLGEPAAPDPNKQQPGYVGKSAAQQWRDSVNLEAVVLRVPPEGTPQDVLPAGAERYIGPESVALAAGHMALVRNFINGEDPKFYPAEFDIDGVNERDIRTMPGMPKQGGVRPQFEGHEWHRGVVFSPTGTAVKRAGFGLLLPTMHPYRAGACPLPVGFTFGKPSQDFIGTVVDGVLQHTGTPLALARR